MFCRHRMIIFGAIIAASFTATAQNVYKNVDNSGAVEFSDQSSPGSKKVNITPENVVDVPPVKPIASSPPESSTKTPDIDVEPKMIQEGGGTYYDDDRNRRQLRKERGERTEHRENAAKAPKESRSITVRGGAHRK